MYVGRPTVWGNHYGIRKAGPTFDVIRLTDDSFIGQSTGEESARAMAARHFDRWLMSPAGALMRQWAREQLRGKDLVCWCPPGPCHADALIRVANKYAPEEFAEERDPEVPTMGEITRHLATHPDGKALL